MSAITRTQPFSARRLVAALVAVALALVGPLAQAALGAPGDVFRISDVTKAEGDTGTTAFTFTITRTSGVGADSVEYSTSNGTAQSGQDYAPATGTVTFAPTETEKTVTVQVVGDTVAEPDETFFVTIRPTLGGSCSDCEGTGTILNDESTFAINDVAQAEGDTGTTAFTFTVTRTSGSGSDQVSYTTRSGTAEAGEDYTPASGTVSFAPGDNSETVTVQVKGDTVAEPDETFFVTITTTAGDTCSDCEGTGTILNDDGTPPALVIDNVAVTETDATTVATFTVRLTQASALPVTVQYNTADGSAKAGQDYVATSGTLTFTPGDTTEQVTVDVIGDDLDEDTEVFFLQLSNSKNAVIEDSQGEARIIDDDTAPTVSVGDATVGEGAGTATVPVTLSGPSGKTVTVQYTTADETATAGADYTAKTGTVTFEPGETVENIEIAIIDDALDEESPETFLVRLTSAVNAAVADGEGTVTINDNDDPPSLSISDVTVEEGDSGTTPATFTVTLSAPSEREVTVTYTTADGTATAEDNDYTPATGTLTFAAGEVSKTIAVPVIGDTRDEVDENFFVNLTEPTNATVADPQGEATITDDDPTPSVSIGDATVTEGPAGTPVEATFTVTLSAPSGLPVQVDYTTADGTATAGSDYVAETGTVTFAPGETTKTITVTVNGDDADEPNEDFFVNLADPVNATIADGQGTGTILDDDAGPTVAISDATVNEGDSGTVTALFTVTLTGSTSQTVTVEYRTEDGTATGGEDYVPETGTVTFRPGQQTQTISITVNGDVIPEIDEQFFVRLFDPANATITDDTGVGTIIDEEGAPPTAAITDVTAPEGDAGTTPFTFTVTLSGPSNGTITIDYATTDGTAQAGSDYEPQSGTLTFEPGQTSQTITVPVIGDQTREATETFQVVLTNPRNVTLPDPEATGTITNDDPLPTVSIADSSQDEGDAGTTEMVFTIRLSNPSDTEVTVQYSTADGTATDGADYTGEEGTVTFAPGETEKTISVTVIGDSIDESNETFTVTLAAPSGAVLDEDPTATGTILDNDVPPTVSISDTRAEEGDPAAVFTVTLSKESGNTVTVRVSTADGTAVSPADYTGRSEVITFAPGETTKTFSVPVVDDSTDEPAETFTANLSEASGATVADGSGEATITDNDTAPTVSISNAPTVAEGDGAAVFTVTLSAASGNPVTVRVSTADGTAVSPADYTGRSEVITFAPGETTKTFSVPVVDDSTDEPAETFTANLSEASGATVADGSGEATITDNDGNPALSVSDVTVTEGTGGTTDATFTVTLAPASGQTVTVDYATAMGTATAPSDYTSKSGMLTFAPGETSKSVSVVVRGDATDEPNQTFRLVLSNPTNAAIADGSGTATITDDDEPAVEEEPPTEDPDPIGESTGYRFIAADGGAFVFGDRAFHGSLGDRVLNKPIVGGATNVKTYNGYWMVASDGGVFNFGDAGFYGSLAGETLDAPIVEIEPTPTGLGYFMVDAKGQVFPFGDAAKNIPDARSIQLNKAIIGMSVTSSGKGYWLVASDGGIFTFGDAKFYGSMGGETLNQPVIDLAPTPDSNGYHLVAADGGVFSFGNAEFKGSTGNIKLNKPAVAMLVAPNGAGYWIVASDGGVFAFGAVPFHGSTGNITLNSPVLDAIH